MTRLMCTASLLSMIVISATGCTPLVEGAKHTAKTLEQARDETAESWTRLFTYHPTPTVEQPPSTRFCYQFQTDIVCYDAPQPQLTAKLVGAQNAQGSLLIQQSNAYDYSAGLAAPVTSVAAAPIVPYTASSGFAATSQDSTAISTSSDISSHRIESHSISEQTGSNVSGKTGSTPFHSKESPYTSIVN